MAWLSRNTFTTSSKLHADDLNNLHNDIVTWGGDVNGGGYTLSNVKLVGVLPLATQVTSVFGRTGDVVAVAGDYTAAMVGAPPTSLQIIAGSGLSGGGALTGNVTLNAAVTSVFGRTGAITLTPTDITNATGVLNTRTINTGTGLTGGGNLASDRTISVVPDSVDQRVQVFFSGGTLPVGTRHAINFIPGSNITLTVRDNSTFNRVDVTVASTAAGMADPTTTLGDLIVRGLSAPGRLAVGSNGQILVVDNTQPLGIKWATPASGGGAAVTSVFGRTGDIVAVTGDYTAAQVRNAVDTTQTYANPSWLTALSWTRITNAPTFLVDPLINKGDLMIRGATATTNLPVGANGQVLMADSTQPTGVHWGSVAAGASQTPWTTNTDAAGFNLSNVNGIGVNGAATTLARISVTAASGEDGLRVTGSAAAGWADISLFNDTGVLLELIAWGSGPANPPNKPFSNVASIQCWAPLLFCQNNVERMRFSSTGQLGIGVSNPAYSVDVAGDVNVTGTYRVNGTAISGAAAQSPWLTDIDAAGFLLSNVKGIGIGAAAAANQLKISAPNPELLFVGPTNNDVANIQMWCGSAYRWDIGVGRVVAGQFYIRDINGGTRLQIDAAGNVGLGHPAIFALDVLGDINCTGTYRVNGVPTGGVLSVFSRTGAVTAAVGDYTAAQVVNAVDMSQSYADPSWLTSLSWSKITGAPAVGVSSVFGRSGAVTAAAGDYTVAQITGAVANTRMIATGAGLTGGGNLSADRTISIVPDSVNQQVQVASGGSVIGTRHAINFVNGANVTISVTDNAAANRVDVSVASTGGTGGGGMVDPTTTLGDLIVRGATAPNRLALGLNGQVLTVDNTQTLGIKWSPAAAPSQSPWVADIDGAFHKLNNTDAIGVNQASNETTARICILTNGGEDGLQTINHVASQFAAISNVNDVADYLRLISYGSGYATDPGISSIESSVALKFLVSKTTEAMRLASSGRVLIGTTTDDGTNLLQVQGRIKSASGGYVFPDGTIQTTAFAAGASPVTSVFGRTGAVVAQSGDYSAAQITNAVSIAGSYSDPSWITGLAWTKITGAPAFLVDPMLAKGDLIVRGTTTTRLAVGLDGQVLVADSTQALGVKWGAPAAASPVTSVFGRIGDVIAVTGDYSAAQITNAVDQTVQYPNPAWITSLAWSKITGTPSVSSYQTPWASNIDGANFFLNNCRGIGIGTTAPAFASSAAITLQQANTNISFNNTAGDSPTKTIGSIIWSDLSITGASNQYAAAILATSTGTTANKRGASLSFYTRADNSDSYRDVMWITGGGKVGVGNDASVAPHTELGYPTLIVGNTAANNTQTGTITVCGNSTTSVNMGALSFANYAITAAEKRIGQILGITSGGVDSGAMIFFTSSAGALGERMRITPVGHLGLGTASVANRLTIDGGHVEIRSGNYLMLRPTDNSWDMRLQAVAQRLDILSGGAPGTPIATFQNGGNVGIATASPAVLLEIAHNGASTFGTALNIKTTAGTDGPRAAFQMYNGGSPKSWNVGILNSSTSFGICEDSAPLVNGFGTPRLVIAPGGMVAVGRIPYGDPSHPFQVEVASNRLFLIGSIGGECTLQCLNDAGNAYQAVTVYASSHRFASGAVSMDNNLSVGGVINFNSYIAGNGRIVARTDDSYLRINESSQFSNGIWLGTSHLKMSTGHLYVGTQGGNGGCVDISATSQDTVNRITINGNSMANNWFNTGAGFGINTTNPVDSVTIAGLGQYGQLRMIYGNYGCLFRNDGGMWYFMTTNSGDPYGTWKGPYPFMIDLASNCVGIRNSPSASWGLSVDSVNVSGQLFCNSTIRVGSSAVSGQAGDLAVSRNSSANTGVVYFGVNGDKYLYYDGGNFQLNAPGGGLYINGAPVTTGGAATVNVYGLGEVHTLWFQAGNNVSLNITNPGGSQANIVINAWAPSDLRIKQNVREVRGGLPIVNQIQPVEFEYNGLAGYEKGKRSVSVIAQELQKILPGAVHPYRGKLRPEDEEESEILSVDPFEMLLHSILAIQELEKRLKALEAKVN